MAGNSDNVVPTEKATKTYVDSGAGPSYVKVSDVKTGGTDGGTFTLGAWRTRVLNYEDSDTDSICSLSSNQITLSAGTYICSISAPATSVNRHKAKLRNTTASTNLLTGTSEFAYPNVSNRSFISGKFTVAASQALEVQHVCETSNTTYGFGVATNAGVPEVYTVAEFWKVG